MSYIDEWNAADVIAETRAEVSSSIMTAGKIVEVDARSRLLSIGDPDWGSGYRRMLALFRLTSVFSEEAREVAVSVGMPGGKAGHDGYYIETGSSTAPAHPWLRPALLGNLRQIVALVGGR